MDKKISNCHPSILNWDTFMSSDWKFMEKDVIKKQCECSKKSVCFEILRLLNEKRVDDAVNLISNTR